MINGIISNSPEEMSTEFFRKLKQLSIPHSITAWSRKDVLKRDSMLYILSQRDYVHLKKLNKLPDPRKICILATENYQIHPVSEVGIWNASAIISGNEQKRGELAAYLYDFLSKKNTGLLKNEVLSPENSFDRLFSLKIQTWLKLKIQSTLFEVRSIDPKNFSFDLTADSKSIEISCKLDIPCPGAEDLSSALTPLSMVEFDSASLLRLSIGSIIKEPNICLIYPSGEKSSIVYMKFMIERNQKKFESIPKLIGVLRDI